MRHRPKLAESRYWIYGYHAIAAALANGRRRKYRLLLSDSARNKLGDACQKLDIRPEIKTGSQFSPPLAADAIHQGMALQVAPLEYPNWQELIAPRSGTNASRLMLLDRVHDPQNIGAVLRSSAVFGAQAVIATKRHSATESGALAKAASGALELVPYLRVGSMAQLMRKLSDIGYLIIGLDGEAESTIGDLCKPFSKQPLALIIGVEGKGLRQLSKERCDWLARIPANGDFASLNLSNAAAIALYETCSQTSTPG